MVLFDKGGHILKSAEIHKEKKEWLYQLKNATELSDRADAAIALRKFKADATHSDASNAPVTNDDVVLALGEVARSDKTWAVRATSADSLAQLGGAMAAKQVLAALDEAKEPWLRSRIVAAMGNFKDNPEILSRLAVIADHDGSYRARAAALQAIGKLKAPNALSILQAAATGDSPDDFLRNAALRSFGSLGDDKAVPLLREWAVAGKPIPSREAAIAGLGRLQKENKEITAQLSSYLSEPHFSIRIAALYALGARADASAIPALEQMLQAKDLSIEMAPMIKAQIARLKRTPKEKPAGESNEEGDDQEEADAAGAAAEHSISADRFDRLEQLIKEMNDRLKSIENRLPPPKP